MKAKCSVFLMIAVVVLLAISVPVHASKMDDERTELSARQSYVFKTYLQADDIKIQSIGWCCYLNGNCLRRIPQVVGPGDRGGFARGQDCGQRAGSQR